MMALRMAVLLLLMPLTAQDHAEAALEVRIDAERCEVGRPCLLVVEARGGEIGEPVLPEIAGAAVQQEPCARKQDLRLDNMSWRQRVECAYRLTPLRAGTLVVPAITVQIDGKEVHSQPFEVEVWGSTKSRSSRSTDSPAQQGGPLARVVSAAPRQPRTLTLGEAVQTRAYVNKDMAYLGEPIILTLAIEAHTGVSVGDRPLENRYPETAGFYSMPENPEAASVQTVNRNGLRYRINEFRQVLYPTRTGDLRIGPWEWTGVAQVRSANGYERVRVQRRTQPLSVKVEPLPARPAEFNGAVGVFSFDGYLTRSEVVQGVTTNLVLRVTGQGNPGAIGEPHVEAPPGLHIGQAVAETTAHPVRDPSMVTVERSFTYPLTPSRTGRLTIGEVDFCYFNYEQERYVTRTAGPFQLDVAPDPAAAEEHGPGGVLQPAPPLSGGGSGEVRPLAAGPGHLSRTGTYAWALPLVFFTPLVGYAALALRLRHVRRLESDGAYARAYHARRRGRRRLAGVFRASRPVDLLHHTLVAFVADKCGVAAAGLTSSDIGQMLKQHGAPAELTDSVTRIVRKCERIRYGGESVSREEVGALVQGAALCMDQLDDIQPGGTS